MRGHHPYDEADQKCAANEYDQIGGEKCHDEPEGILEMVGSYQKVDSEGKKEAPHQRENHLSYPPKNT